MESLIPIAAIFLIFWLLIIRPANKRQKALAQVQRELAIGDRVITSSGMFGHVASLEDDIVGLEVSPGVVISVARPSIVGLPGVPASDEVNSASDNDPDTER